MYIHLNVRSQYSLDSLVQTKTLIQQCKKMNMTSVGMTDKGTLYQVYEFYKEAKRGGVKPLFGSDFDIVDEKGQTSGTVKLISKDNSGYKNLVRLSSICQLRDAKNITRKDLEQGIEGNVVILTSVRKKDFLNYVIKQVGVEDLYFGIFRDERGEITAWEKTVLKLKEAYPFKMVGLQKVNYFHPEDALYHALLIGENEFETNQRYFKDSKEMEEIYKDIPEAVERTVEIANKCEVNLPIKGEVGYEKKLPSFEVPKQFKGIKNFEQLFDKVEPLNYELNEKERKSAEYLVALSWRNFKKMYDKNDKKLYRNGILRLKKELGIIIGRKFMDYLLIVGDLAFYAKKQGIPMAPGRGSATGSLLARCLGITEPCPLEHNLIFERFSSEERIDEPDIDLDIGTDGQPKLIRYFINKYGKNHVAGIISFNTHGIKSAIKHVSDIYGVPDKEVRKITKFFKKNNDTVDSVEASSASAHFRKTVESIPEMEKVLKYAEKIMGFPKNITRHAAGYVLSQEDITEELPVIKAETDELGEFYVSQISITDGAIEKMGYTKFDFLVNRSVDLLNEISQKVKENEKEKEQKILFTDPKTLRLYYTGKLLGVFQMDSVGMRKVAKMIGISSLEDIISLIALYRPGPIDNIPQFAKNKKAKSVNVIEGAEDLIPILKRTYGILVFQEQILEVLKVWAGYRYGEADVVRKAVSKKNHEIIEKERKRFMEKSKKSHRPEKVSEQIYDLIVKFAEYGFGRAHATAYAILGYRLAWFKAHYPKEFFAAVLTNAGKNRSKTFKEYILDAQQLGVRILPLDINASQYEFTVEKEGVRFGFCAIKSLGATFYSELNQIRGKEGFLSYEDFLRKTVNISKKMKEILIYAGLFDCFGERNEMISRIEMIPKKGQMLFSEIPGIKRKYNAKESDGKWEKAEMSYTGVVRKPFSLTLNVPENKDENFLKKMLERYPGENVITMITKNGEMEIKTEINCIIIGEIKEFLGFDYFVQIHEYV